MVFNVLLKMYPGGIWPRFPFTINRNCIFSLVKKFFFCFFLYHQVGTNRARTFPLQKPGAWHPCVQACKCGVYAPLRLKISLSIKQFLQSSYCCILLLKGKEEGMAGEQREQERRRRGILCISMASDSVIFLWGFVLYWQLHLFKGPCSHCSSPSPIMIALFCALLWPSKEKNTY